MLNANQQNTRFQERYRLRPYHGAHITNRIYPFLGAQTYHVNIVKEIVAIVLGKRDDRLDSAWRDVQIALGILVEKHVSTRKARRAGVEDVIDEYWWRHAGQRKDWRERMLLFMAQEN